MNIETTIIAQAMADDVTHWAGVLASEHEDPTVPNVFVEEGSLRRIGFAHRLQTHFDGEAARRVGRKTPMALVLHHALSKVDWEFLADEWIKANELGGPIRAQITWGGKVKRAMLKLLPGPGGE